MKHPLLASLLMSGLLAILNLSATESGVVPLDPAIIHGRLPNGLTYYIQENATPEDRVELRLVVDAGSVMETDAQRGAAHFVEHLCFRGTRSFPQASLVSFLEELGADFGPHVNALTTFDETVYRLSLALSEERPGTLETGLRILREWATAVNFDPAEVEKERGVILAEWRERLGPSQRLLRAALPVLYPESRYADRLPIADRESIESISVEALERFYREWYRPERMAVVVTGAIDSAAVRERIETLFGNWERGAGARARPEPAAPLPTGGEVVRATDPEFGYHLVRLVYPALRTKKDDLEAFHEAVARRLVASLLQQRLEERKEAEPWVFQVARVDPAASHVRSREDLSIFALVGAERVGAGGRALMEEVERVRRAGFAAEELAREMANARGAAEARYEGRNDRESGRLADACVAHFLRGESLASPEWEYVAATEYLGALELEAVNAVARRVLEPSGVLVRLEGPASAEASLPSREEIEEMLAAVRGAELGEIAAKRTPPSSFLTRVPEPGRIVARRHFEKIGVSEWALSNGARVVLKPNDFRANEIHFSGLRPGGLSTLPLERDLAGKVAPGYVFEAGFGELTKNDLARLLAGKQAGLGVRLDPAMEVLKGQCVPNDLETLLQLIHLAFTPPRRDEAVLESVLELNRSFETNVVMNPALAFLQELQAERFGGHPRAPLLIQPPATWEALRLEEVIAAYVARFGGVRGFTFFFVGNFEVEALEPLLERYLASLPPGEAAAEAVDVGLRQIAGPLHREIRRGADPRARLVFCHAVEAAQWSLHEAHLLWSLGNILRRSLLEKLRLEEGGVYTVQVDSSFERSPFASYRLEVSIPCSPAEREAAVQGLNEIVERIRREGPTTAELQKEVEAQRAAQIREQSSNSDWLWKLELIYRDNEGFGRLEEPLAMSGWLNSEALREVAERFWRTDAWVRFDHLPKTDGRE
jgi:zinc protease